jgi:hypothetical protein
MSLQLSVALLALIIKDNGRYLVIPILEIDLP